MPRLTQARLNQLIEDARVLNIELTDKVLGDVEMVVEEPDKLRFVISGSVEGHNVLTHVYESDLEDLDNPESPRTDLIQFEPGIVSLIVQTLHEHGILPWERGGSNTQKTGNEIQSEGWQCPLHGSQALGKNFFDKTGNTKQCIYKEEATSFTPPEWSSKKTPTQPKGSDKHYWYCKHREG